MITTRSKSNVTSQQKNHNSTWLLASKSSEFQFRSSRSLCSATSTLRPISMLTPFLCALAAGINSACTSVSTALTSKLPLLDLNQWLISASDDKILNAQLEGLRYLTLENSSVEIPVRMWQKFSEQNSVDSNIPCHACWHDIPVLWFQNHSWLARFGSLGASVSCPRVSTINSLPSIRCQNRKISLQDLYRSITVLSFQIEWYCLLHIGYSNS